MRTVSQSSVAGWLCAGAIGATQLMVARSASAEVVDCGLDVCASSFSIFVGDSTQETGGGQFVYDPDTGVITLDTVNNIRGGGMLDTTTGGLMWNMPDGTAIQVGNVGGNADPILTFALGTTTQAVGTTVSFQFNLPISLNGPVRADSSIGYVMTVGGSTPRTSTISPFGGPTVLVARDVDFDTVPISELNKGVDIGTTFSVTGNPLTQGTQTFAATNFFNLASGYDLMALRISYALTPFTSIGISGGVSQILVPIPAALPLLISGLFGFCAVSRRRLAAA